jgi:hypothetical protein
MLDIVDREIYEQTSLWGIAIKAKRVVTLLTAKASTTEEPREGKLHAGICTGGAGSTGVPTVTNQFIIVQN